MSDTDSFIDEVTEEVRRERLYGQIRRYGWIGIVVVLALVGGAAFNEYRANADRAEAEARGDAMLAALNKPDGPARAEALAAIETEGGSAAIAAMLAAATLEEEGKYAEARAALEALSARDDIPAPYREIAAFKAALYLQDDPVALREAMAEFTAPGAPFRLLAMEQMASAAISLGETDEARRILAEIDADAEVGAGLRDRVQTMMLALGDGAGEGAASQ